MIVDLENITCGYFKKPILRDISLQIRSGEIVAVVGPNGVGKSTLIRAVSGSLEPLQGCVLMDGQSLFDLPVSDRAQRVSVVPQALNLPEAFTALDVVLMGRTPYLNWFERESQKDYEIAMTSLKRTETDHLAQRRMGELSGGERQRVLIARALAQTTPVMLFDEPTAHLDLRHQEQLLKLIRALCQEERLAILIALHDLNLVSRLADRVALLSDGTVYRLGIPEEVLTPDQLANVYGIKIEVISHPSNGKTIILPVE